MRKVINFNAGPAMLPEEVLLQAQAELLDWHGTGMSVMELGHRGAHFKIVAEQTEADLRELMNIPDHYHVLFLSGGASAQFAMVPINLFVRAREANYIDTGIWSKKAIAEASRYGHAHVAAVLEMKDGLLHIPEQNKWSLKQDAAYLHFTPNETIEGIEFHWTPKTHVPLVADMSSMILSREINVNDYGIIYAGAQKNMGQAGVTVVIIHDDLVQEPLPGMPSLYSYKLQVENKSFYNTPPTYSWYLTGLMLSWMRKQGGVKAFSEKNKRNAQKLYHVIDQYSDFYQNPVHSSCRSLMNVPFNLHTPELNQLFLTEAEKINLVNLKGHRLVGGVRVSLYNAMPEEAVDKLVEFMQLFVKKYG